MRMSLQLFVTLLLTSMALEEWLYPRSKLLNLVQVLSRQHLSVKFDL